MADNPTCHLHHLPSKGSNGLLYSRLRTRESFESDEKIVGQNAYPEKHGIGIALPTRHPLHPKPNFQLLVKVLCLPPLVMPLQHLTCILLLLKWLSGYEIPELDRAPFSGGH